MHRQITMKEQSPNMSTRIKTVVYGVSDVSVKTKLESKLQIITNLRVDTSLKLKLMLTSCHLMTDPPPPAYYKQQNLRTHELSGWDL